MLNSFKRRLHRMLPQNEDDINLDIPLMTKMNFEILCLNYPFQQPLAEVPGSSLLSPDQPQQSPYS
jgi:hypothetical protein